MDKTESESLYQQLEREWRDARLALIEASKNGKSTLPPNVKWDDTLGWDYITATCGH